MPEAPLGTAAASFAGGGSGHDGGISAVFDNPAALSIGEEFQVEAGLMGLSAGLSPYLLFGSAASARASYALGYFYDARPGNPEDPVNPRQGLIAGASWEAAPGLSLGASVRSLGTGAGVGRDGFGIDGDAGMVASPWGPLRIGVTVRNLLESGVGHEPDGFETHRSYGAALGASKSHLRLPGLTLHHPDAYYEWRAAESALGSAVHAFSLASAFTPGGRLGFRGTWLLPPGGDPGFAIGTFLDLPAGRGGILCGYVFHSGHFRETGDAGPSHSISIRFRRRGKTDPIPPWVEVRVDKVLIAADGKEIPQAHFHLQATDRTHSGESGGDGRIKEWTLAIRKVGEKGLAGAEVKSYHGMDLPPRVIRWRAADEAGMPLPPGFYAFRFSASDPAGNTGTTAWQLMEIRNPVSEADSMRTGAPP